MQPLDQLTSHVQERDARDAHEVLEIPGREEVHTERRDVHRHGAERLVGVDVEHRALFVAERGEPANVLGDAIQVVAVTGGHEQRIGADACVVFGGRYCTAIHGHPGHPCTALPLREPHVADRWKFRLRDDNLAACAGEMQRACHGARRFGH